MRVCWTCCSQLADTAGGGRDTRRRAEQDVDAESIDDDADVLALHST